MSDFRARVVSFRASVPPPLQFTSPPFPLAHFPLPASGFVVSGSSVFQTPAIYCLCLREGFLNRAPRRFWRNGVLRGLDLTLPDWEFRGDMRVDMWKSILGSTASLYPLDAASGGRPGLQVRDVEHRLPPREPEESESGKSRGGGGFCRWPSRAQLRTATSNYKYSRVRVKRSGDGALLGAFWGVPKI